MGQVFRHGIATGRCDRNPVPDLRGALKPVMVKHMAALLEPAQVGKLLRACDGYMVPGVNYPELSATTIVSGAVGG